MNEQTPAGELVDQARNSFLGLRVLPEIVHRLRLDEGQPWGPIRPNEEARAAVLLAEAGVTWADICRMKS